MEKKHVAWSNNCRGEVSVVYEKYQGPSLLGDLNFVDISVSASERVFVLSTNGEYTNLDAGESRIPSNWERFNVILPGGININKIDASPKNIIYAVLSDGTLGKIAVSNNEGKLKVIKGVEGVTQVSAAPDGLVWVVATNGDGSEVKFYNGKKWTNVPGIEHAMRVTGTEGGQAYVVRGNGEISLVSAKGIVKKIPFSHNPTELSVGPDGTLWAIAQNQDFTGGTVYTTNNQGTKWSQVEGADAKYLDAGLLID